MDKTILGFVCGFSFAVFVFSLMLFFYLTPHLEEMRSVHSSAETIYDITHTTWFTPSLSILDTVGSIGGMMPIVGSYASYAGELKSVLISARDYSNDTTNILEQMIFVTNYLLNIVIVSFVAFAVSLYLTVKSKNQSSKVVR